MVLHFVFSVLWILPLYLISKVVMGFWFTDVAEAVYKVFYGPPRSFSSISTAAADFLYSTSFETLVLLQAMVINRTVKYPFNQVLYSVHICLLYALYAFEYKWFNRGLQLRVRLQLLETNWPYFCGFGFPLYVATHIVFSYYPVVVSGCIFSILFPFMIVSGTRASSPSSGPGIKLPLFQPSAWLCSLIFTSSIGLKRAT